MDLGSQFSIHLKGKENQKELKMKMMGYKDLRPSRGVLTSSQQSSIKKNIQVHQGCPSWCLVLCGYLVTLFVSENKHLRLKMK
jgi:hypothetical protein